jgi:hypothetical protein
MKQGSYPIIDHCEYEYINCLKKNGQTVSFKQHVSLT